MLWVLWAQVTWKATKTPGCWSSERPIFRPLFLKNDIFKVLIYLNQWKYRSETLTLAEGHPVLPILNLSALSSHIFLILKAWKNRFCANRWSSAGAVAQHRLLWWGLNPIQAQKCGCRVGRYYMKHVAEMLSHGPCAGSSISTKSVFMPSESEICD